MEKIDIKSLPLSELRDILTGWGEPGFRAEQVYTWMHQKQALAFDGMSNLPKALRGKLEERCFITELTVRRRLVSQIDGTVKYLYGLPDGETVEGVLMRYKHGDSLCISTQVGCRMGCNFCASTLLGLERDLTPAEMLEEVYLVQRDSGRKVSSLVLMGIGEPLDNYENVLTFLRMLSSEQGLGLSLRHVSLSTCGLVPRIYDLMGEKLQLTLSVSLHAPDNETRSRTMPVNRRYPVEELMAACREYFKVTGRRISFEYALIQGVNDTEECAGRLAELLAGLPCHVNLIPVNSVTERGYQKSSPQQIRKFIAVLERRHINTTVRRELGADINAACGQLRRADKGESVEC